MKTKTILTIAAAILVMSFASCTKERGLSNGSVEEGKATSMTVSITFPNNVTRATSDPNATDNEAQINTVDVFIYTGTGAFSSCTSLTAADFTSAGPAGDADRYTAKAKIATSTGEKTVFVGINLTTRIVTAVKNQPASTLAWVAQTMNCNEVANATASNFVMFSTPGVKSVFVEDQNNPANSITVKCERLVAKVTVETDAAMVQAGFPGTMGALEFAVNNCNQKFFLVQSDPPYYQDPNWATGSYNSADFNAVLGAYSPILRRSVIPTPVLTDYTPQYAAENTSEGKLKKEIGRVTVRTTFIPKEIYEYANGVDNAAGYKLNDSHGVTTPTTFYAYTPSLTDGTFFFFDGNVMNHFKQDVYLNLGNSVTYSGGYCYWDIFLNKNPKNIVNRWDVLRNDYYKCNITRIVLPGRGTPGLIDPDVTPDVDTSIDVTVDVKFWHTPILSDYILE